MRHNNMIAEFDGLESNVSPDFGVSWVGMSEGLRRERCGNGSGTSNLADP